MSVYARYKRSSEGFRALVELLESTPSSRRKRMVDIGMAEDPEFTQRALQYMMSFEDILKLSEGELAEVTAEAPPRSVGLAVALAAADVKERFVRSSPVSKRGEVRDASEMQVSPREVGGAQMKLVEVARSLERKGTLQTKRIPPG